MTEHTSVPQHEKLIFVGGHLDGRRLETPVVVGEYYDAKANLYVRTDEVREGHTVFIPARKSTP
jgi:hypothetical protein